MQNVFKTPLYSQYRDIKNKRWKARACGIAAFAMMCEYHHPERHISFPRLIREATQQKGYIPNIGWKHAALAACAGLYGLRGKNCDLANEPLFAAERTLKMFLKKGPVVVSTWRDHRRRTGGHLVTAVGFDASSILLNDPRGRTDRTIQRRVSWSDFRRMWKKRIIVASLYGRAGRQTAAKTPAERKSE